MGKVLVIIGVLIVVFGLVIMLVERAGWRGLPGDIVVRRDGVTIFFPIVTMILLSLILTLILNFVLRR